jgi:hypothetical protein
MFMEVREGSQGAIIRGARQMKITITTLKFRRGSNGAIRTQSLTMMLTITTLAMEHQVILMMEDLEE